MALGQLVKSAKDKVADAGVMAAEKVADSGAAATEKLNEMLDDYRAAVDHLRKFGFEVGRFQVGMGILPEVQTSISGSIARVEEDEMRALAEQSADRRLLAGIARALVAAKEFRKRVDIEYDSVTVDVKLGLPPRISFDLHA